MGLFAYGRLIRAGFVLAREGAFSLINTSLLPLSARVGVRTLRLVERRSVRKSGRVERLTRALNRLGPTYVKFGQLLGTRPDVVGMQIAEDLSSLQDRMPPFDATLVPDILTKALGEKAADLIQISAPIAAASVAQVHKAILVDHNGDTKQVAVKILRPDVSKRFRSDLDSFYAGAKLAEFLLPGLKRLKPVSVVKILDQSARLELDLRFEAACLSEFAENIAQDDGFDVPKPSWDHVAANVMVIDWVDGVPIRETEALDKAGVNRPKLAAHLMQSFLRHAIRDGFFHADMHPGNLFADPKTHGVIAVDFGITGRIGPRERKFLAEILYGFITRDYRLIAKRHFEIGYVPANQSIDDFTLALRSIGEPLHGRLSREISMAWVLGQLFSVTDMFDMQARPELILLQKTMVLVEGVARGLDPDLNIWDVSKPVVKDWLQRQAGPVGQIETLKDHATRFADALGEVPTLIHRASSLLDKYETDQIAHQENKGRWAKWALAASIAVILGIGLWSIG